MAKKSRRSSLFDTGKQHLGSVYAKALLGATERSGTTEQIVNQLGSLVEDVLDAMPAFEGFLESPRVTHEEKSVMLERAFGSTMASELLIFLKVVARHGRLDCLRTIHSAAHEQFNVLRGQVDVELRTADPVDASLLATVSQSLSTMLGCTVEMQSKIDPEVLGGAVIRVGDTLYDGSVAHRLAKLRDQTITNTARQIRVALERFAKDNGASEPGA